MGEVGDVEGVKEGLRIFWWFTILQVHIYAYR